MSRIKLLAASILFVVATYLVGSGEIVLADEGASILSLGKTVEGVMSASATKTEYQLKLKSSGRLFVEVDAQQPSYKLQLTSGSGKVWKPLAYSEESGKRVQEYELNKGSYHILVSTITSNDTIMTENLFHIKPSFVSAKASNEANATKKRAKDITKLIWKYSDFKSQKPLCGHIAQNSKREYFRFTVKKQTVYRIEINGTDNYRWELTNRRGRCVMVGSTCIDSDENQEDWIAPKYAELTLYPGTYYICVSPGKEKAYGKYYLGLREMDRYFGELSISEKEAVYTGNAIEIPQAILKGKNEEIIDSSRYRLTCQTVEKGEYDFEKEFFSTMKDVGKYYIKVARNSSETPWDQNWNMDMEFWDLYAGDFFIVRPVQGAFSNVSSRKKGIIETRMKKDSQSTGYQIQIAKDSRFKNIIQTVKSTKTKKILKGLKSGGRYYVRVRNYKDIINSIQLKSGSKESIYGQWSEGQEIRCK